MPELLRCPQGHEWERAAEGPPACPVCGAGGAPGETLAPPPAPARPASPAAFTETLAPPAAPTGRAKLSPPGGPTAPPGPAYQETLAPPPAPARPPETSPGLGETLAPPATKTPAPPPTQPPQGAALTETLAPPVPPAGTGIPKPDAGTAQHGAAHTIPAVTGLVIGPTIPGYKLLGELGRGAMGVVYKARDVRLDRLVALKMILSGDYAAAEDLARFRTEAEAVARLQHPNIVQVYEIDECDGRPYFCLEFVDGGPLDKCLAGNPQPPRLAARLVQQLAQAIHYAHQHGIIHRDLKPANILLSFSREPGASAGSAALAPGSRLNEGIPKITDFGLAKKLDDADSQTHTGSIMGTPSYMAPEQAEGRTREIGPPADTYAVGAILYECLTGRPPFKGATVLDTLEQVRSQEPLPPSRLQPKVPRDLETICLKCLHKDIPSRYASAGDLADDLGRWLAGEPIRARPTPVWERAWKWARRRPAVAALVAVSVAALVGLAAGGVLYARLEGERAAEAERLQKIAEGERAKAEANEKIARQQRARAEENFQQARDAVDQLTQIGHRRLAHEPHMELVRRDILEKALRFHYRFLAANGQNPALRWETGRAHLRAGEIEEMLGRHAAAEKAYRAARDYFTALHKEDPARRDYRQDLAATWNDLGILYQATGRPKEAGDAFRDALALKEGLVKDFPRARAFRGDLGNGYNNRGNFLQSRQRLAEARADYERARALYQRLASDYPLRPAAPAAARRGGPEGEDQVRADYQQELARSHLNLGAVWLALGAAGKAATEEGWAGQAEDAFGRAEKLLGGLADLFPDVPDYQRELAAVLLNRATLRHLGKRPAEARADYEAAARRLARLADQFRSVPDYRQLLANTYVQLGDLLRATRQTREAARVWRLSLPVLATLADEFRQEPRYRQLLGRSHNELAIALAMQNQPDEALKAWAEALPLQEKLVADHPANAAYWQDLIDSLTNLTTLRVALAPSREAEASARRLIAAQERRVKAFPRVAAYRADLARADHTLAAHLLQRKTPAAARPALEAAVRHAREALDLGGPTPAARQALCKYAVALVELLLDQGDHRQARQAVEALAAAVPPRRHVAGIVAPEQAAALLARCVPLAGKDPKLAAAQRKELEKAYGDAALKLLRQAVADGYTAGGVLKNAADFEALRPREDFQRLIRQLESGR